MHFLSICPPTTFTLSLSRKPVKIWFVFGIASLFLFFGFTSQVQAVNPSSKWFVTYGAQTSTSVVRQFPPFGGNLINGEASAIQLTPSAGTVQKLRVQLDAAPGSGKSYVITFRKELEDTSLTCTVSNLETSCSNIINTATIVAGDRLTVQITPSSGTPAAARVSFNLEFVPTTTGETVLMGGSSSGALPANETVNCGSFLGVNMFSCSNEGLVQTLIPTSGTLKNLHVRLGAAPGTGNSRTFTVRKNGVDTALTITFNAGDSGVLADTNAGHNLTVAAGDYITLGGTGVGTPTVSQVNYGIVFVPDTEGDFIIPPNTNSSASATEVRYFGLSGVNTVSATETAVQTLGWSDYTLTAVFVKLFTAPGLGKSFTTGLRENGGNASNPFTVTISGASDTTGSLTGQSFTPTDGARYNTIVTPSNTPLTGRVLVSYLGHMVVDSTPPVISSIDSSTTTTTATITWTTDEASDSTVNYGTTSGYGTASTSASLVTSHSIVLTGLSDGTLYHFNVVSTDASTNTSTSSDNTFTTVVADVTSPVQSSITSSPSYTTATITWTTDEGSDTQIDYGLTSSYGFSTTLASSLVTSHSQTLSELKTGTVYHYRVRSTDSSDNLAVSSDQTFTTTSFGGTIPVVDIYADMENGTNGETLTPTILTAGTRGSNFAWITHSTDPYDGPFTAMIVSTSTNAERALPISVQVESGGTIYSDVSHTRGWAYDQGVPDQEITLIFGSSHDKLTASGFAQFNAVLQLVGGNEQWDQLVMSGTGPGQGGGIGTQSAVMQQHLNSLVNELRVHVAGTTGGTTFGVGVIPITAGKTYWYSMQWNKTDLKVYLSLYDPITWELVGTSYGVIYNDANQNGTVRAIQLIQDHAVVSPGTYQNWDDLLIDYTNALYPLVPDAYPPTVSMIAPANSAIVSGSSVTLTASSADNVSIAGVQFKLDTNTNIGSEDTASPYTLSWDSAVVGNGVHTLTAVSRDTMGNYATSSAVTVTVNNDVTAPVISSASAATGANSATLTWTTDEEASSRIAYGPIGTFGHVTTETDTSTRVTSHSVTLSNLLSCTKYYYQVQSRDAVLNQGIGSGNFITTGCTGDAAVESNTSESVQTSSGSTVELLSSGKGLRLTIPSGFHNSDAIFQITKIDKTSSFSAIGVPSGRQAAGNYVYNLRALTDSENAVSSFSAPITITLLYSASDISGINESSLRIYRNDGSSWSELSGCSVDTSAKSVTCTTTVFSTFSIFGDSSGSGEDGESGVRRSRSDERNNYDNSVNILLATLRSLIVQARNAGVEVPMTARILIGDFHDIFIRNLTTGSAGEDIRLLQQFLNLKGFMLAETGPGSRGNETSRFGSLTRTALARFQYANNISPASGYFGPITRHYIESLTE